VQLNSTMTLLPSIMSIPLLAIIFPMCLMAAAVFAAI
jgi:hypothetical protein